VVAAEEVGSARERRHLEESRGGYRPGIASAAASPRAGSTPGSPWVNRVTTLSLLSLLEPRFESQAEVRSGANSQKERLEPFSSLRFFHIVFHTIRHTKMAKVRILVNTEPSTSR
jgi:hypothetical protein